MRSKSCKRGYISRKSYTRTLRSGKKIRIKSKCIKSTSYTKKKRSDIDKKNLLKKSKIYREAIKIFGTPRCKKGEIIREGYYRKSFKNKSGTKIKGSWVSPKCIKSVTGKPHGEQLFVLEKGVLGKYGYKEVSKLSKEERHKSLKKAIKDGVEHITIIKRLNALSILNKNKNPILSKLYKTDMKYIQKLY